MKLFEKKEGMSLIYCGLFVILAIMAFVLEIMKADYTIGLGINFVIAFYLLIILLLKNKKVSDLFSVMLAICLFFILCSRTIDLLPVLFSEESISSFGIKYTIGGCISVVIQLLVYLYYAMRVFFNKNVFCKSKVVYFIISGLTVINFIIPYVLSVTLTNGRFLILDIVVNLVFWIMKLVFIRYAYLYE